jgi:hypothetical protein
LDDAVHLHTLKHISATTDPADFNAVDPFPLAQAEMGIHRVMTLIAATAVDLVHEGQIAGDYLDPRTDTVTVGARTVQPDLNPVILARAIVPQDRWLTPRIENDDVDVPVVVQIVERRSTTAPFE